jgi:photosystem II stability/assembly factor-like uncharacterized protein
MNQPYNLPRKFSASFLLAFALASVSSAQNFWQPTGGPTGADVRALIVNANQTIFAGTIDNGAFRSRDRGNSWTPINNDTLDQTVLALAQNSSGYLFAATLGGVFRSLDEGDNWTRGNTGLTTLNIRGLALNAGGDLFAGTVAGVFRSSNNGASWTPLRNGLADTISVEDLAINSSGHVFAATFRNGVFRSTDNGNSWSAVNAGLTNRFVFALAINNNGDLFAGTNSGVFRSFDNGNTWTATGLSLGLVRAFAITAQGDIFAGTEGDGVFRSQDNGDTWSSIVNTGLTNNVVNALALDAQSYLYAGTRGDGVFRSTASTINLQLQTFPDTTTTVDGPILAFALDDYFDNSGGSLLYSVSASDSSKLFVQILFSSNVLQITPLAVGSAKVVVEAFDFMTPPSTSDTFQVIVTSATQPPGLAKVYWTEFSSNSIQRANSDGAQRETLVDSVSNKPLDLAIDLSRGKMYWSEFFNAGFPKIQRANLDGSGLETVIAFSGLIVVPSIALDIPNQKIYWAANPTTSSAETNAGRSPGAIARANFDGSNIETFNTTVEFPVGLAVGGGYVYWYDDVTGWIQRASTSDGKVDSLVEQPAQQISPLALDAAAGKIYWIADDYLRRANLDGSNAENLLIDTGLANDLTLDLSRSKVYWTDGAAIVRANLDGSHLETLPLANLFGVYGLAVGDTLGNRAPKLANEIPEVTLVATNPGFKLVLDLSNVFSDPDADALSFTATSSNPAVAVATITGSILTVAPKDSGSARITVTANDGRGGTASTTFTARTVTSNAAPRLVAGIADQVLTKGEPAFTRNLSAHFADADGDALVFGATSSTPQIATANLKRNSDTLAVAPIDTGRAVIVVFASDGKGGQAADTFNVAVYISPPPVIAHANVTQQNFNQSLNLSAKITDNENAVRSATLYYREAGESNFVLVRMDTARVGVDTLNATATIPSNAVGASGLEYYLLATDKHNVPGRAPQAGVYSVRVQIGGEGIDRGAPQTAGTAQTGYRLFSIPLELDNKNPEAVLADDLGAYDDRQWRFYEWTSDAQGNLAKAEYPNTNEFTPGKAFWLIVRNRDRRIDSGPGKTVSTAGKFAINLNKGWNLIANPFNFAASAAPLLANGDSLWFYAYENGWSAPRRPSSRNKLDPFEGYAVFSGAATAMFILPNEFAAQNAALPKTAPNAMLWYIRIMAQCQAARDENNLLAVMNSAAREWDAQDHAEPPPIGEYVSVYFPHEEWRRLSKNYCTDIRPEPLESEEWDFAIETNIRDEVRLSFEGVTSVPGEYEVWLIDKAVQIAQDLRRNNHYSVAGRGPENPKQLTLVISRPGKMKEEDEALQAVPASFELSQNFPNPFNPATTIRYALPQAERVTLQVLNLLGELVATLVDNEQREAGYHVAVWNGRNAEGRAVGNGVYFVRMQAGEFVRVRKVVLVE